MTREELGAFLQRERMRGKLFEIKLRGLELEQRYMEVASPEEWRAYVLYKKELEKRYNHNHDTKTGRFTSGNGSATGFYSMSKGNIASVEVSSDITTHETNYPKPLTRNDLNDRIGTSEGVKSCNSFDDVKEYMKNTYDISVSDDVKQLNLETVKEGLSGFEAIAKDYPEIAKDLSVIRVDPREKAAYAGTDGKTLLLSPLDFGNPDKMKEDLHNDTEAGFFAAGEGMTAKDVISHEAGHMVARALVERRYSNDSLGHMAADSDWAQGNTAKEIFNNAYERVKNDPQFKGMKKSDIIKSMSGYVADSTKPRTVHNEAIAEAFSDFYKNGENAHPLSLAIVNEVNKLRKGAKW